MCPPSGRTASPTRRSSTCKRGWRRTSTSELRRESIPGNYDRHLHRIHHHLLQDVYPWTQCGRRLLLRRRVIPTRRSEPSHESSLVGDLREQFVWGRSGPSPGATGPISRMRAGLVAATPPRGGPHGRRSTDHREAHQPDSSTWRPARPRCYGKRSTPPWSSPNHRPTGGLNPGSESRREGGTNGDRGSPRPIGRLLSGRTESRAEPVEARGPERSPAHDAGYEL